MIDSYVSSILDIHWISVMAILLLKSLLDLYSTHILHGTFVEIMRANMDIKWSSYRHFMEVSGNLYEQFSEIVWVYLGTHVDDLCCMDVSRSS